MERRLRGAVAREAVDEVRVDVSRRVDEGGGGAWGWLCDTLLAPVEGHSLATFRVMYGLCLFNQSQHFREVFDNFTVRATRGDGRRF
jgi:hypothetical protein